MPLAAETGADVLVVNEPPGDVDETALLQGLREIAADFQEPPTGPDRRFRCYTRDADLDLTQMHSGSRTSVRRLRLGGEVLLMAFVHGLDVRNYSDARRQSFAERVAGELRFAASQQGTDRLVIVGDFNMNPYDPGMTLAAGLNSVMTRACAARGSRSEHDRSYEFFYNPMWNLFGDDTPGPAGTVWDGSGQGPYGWSMFDQVLIHHSLVPRFRGVRILTKAGGVTLTTPNGRPDGHTASDHFPILVTLSEREPDE